MAGLSAIPAYPERPEGLSDHEFLEQVRARGPLAIDKFGVVSVFSYAHMQTTTEDSWTRQIESEFHRVAGYSEGTVFDFIDNVMLFSNGQAHRNRRGPLARTFAHRLIAELRPEVRARTERLIGPLVGRGSVDFLNEISGPLPAEVIAAVIGAPEEDSEAFSKLVYSAIRALAIRRPEIMEEAGRDLAELNAYVANLLEARRKAPSGDMISTYLERVGDGNLTEIEILTQIVGLVLAGSDTTRAALALTVKLLLQNPDQWTLLQEDPEAHAYGAVQEGLRFEPVVGTLARVVTQAREIEGIRLPEGTIVAPSMLMALRDPEVFADPDRFDITRSDHPRWHPAFGTGAHRCLGEALARIELEEALKTLVRLAPDMTLEIAPDLRGFAAVRAISPMQVRM